MSGGLRKKVIIVAVTSLGLGAALYAGIYLPFVSQQSQERRREVREKALQKMVAEKQRERRTPGSMWSNMDKHLKAKKGKEEERGHDEER